jgi:hypothetical protein
MELHPSFRYLSRSFPHSSGQFLHSSGSPSDAPPELSASEVLQTSLGPYWTLSEIKGTILRWGAQHMSWGQSPSESVILNPPRDCMHWRAMVFNTHTLKAWRTRKAWCMIWLEHMGCCEHKCVIKQVIFKIKLLLKSGECAKHVNYCPVRSIYTVSISTKACSWILAIST